MENKVTDFSGKWKMKSSENFEELLKALGELLVIKCCYCDALLCNLDKLSKPACSQLYGTIKLQALFTSLMLLIIH